MGAGIVIWAVILISIIFVGKSQQKIIDDCINLGESPVPIENNVYTYIGIRPITSIGCQTNEKKVSSKH